MFKINFEWTADNSELHLKRELDILGDLGENI